MKKAPKFTLGQPVTMTNPQGVVFAGKIITGIEVIRGSARYFIAPTDTPWFGFPEVQISPAR